eukprot:159687-Alexandrium_andersonii.AAC.1
MQVLPLSTALWNEFWGRALHSEVLPTSRTQSSTHLRVGVEAETSDGWLANDEAELMWMFAH